MTQIVAAWAPPQGADCTAHVVTMLQALADCPCDLETSWSNGRMALGCRLVRFTPESQEEVLPLVDVAGGLVLTGDLRLDDRDSLCNVLRLPAATPDSQLVLEAYRRWGPRCMLHLQGDLAFVIADLRRVRLLCARDAMGVRPLYTTRLADGCLALASDPRALRAVHGPHPDIEQHLNQAFVTSYLRVCSFSHRWATFDARIRKLPPGHLLQVDAAGLRTQRWWHPEEVRIAEELELDEAAGRLAEVVKVAVTDRLRTRQRIGLHVSGGLDSGVVAAHAVGHLRAHGQPEPLAYGWTPTFSNHTATQEERRVRATAQHLNLAVEPCDLTLDDLWSYLASDPADLPLEDTVLYETHLLRRARAQGVEVMLSGWGGDEFVSYYGQHLPAELLDRGQWRALAAELAQLPRQWPLQRLRRLLRPILLDWTGFPRFTLGDEVLAPSWAAAHPTPVMPWPVRAQERMLAATRVPPLTHRLESWAALGARHGMRHTFPLLDRRVIEQTLRLPPQVFSSGTSHRLLMRALAAPLLPASVAQETDKVDAHRMQHMHSLYREAFDRLADRITAERLPPSRVRFVQLDFVQRWVRDARHPRFQAIQEALRFLRVAAT